MSKLKLFTLLTLFISSLQGCVSSNSSIQDKTAIGDENIHINILEAVGHDPMNVGNILNSNFKNYNVSSQIVDKVNSRRSGSGFVIADGYWITNFHVIDGLETINIATVDRNIPATVIATDENSDLALLKADTTGFLPIKIGKADVAEQIFAIGYPMPDMLGSQARVTSGLINSLAGFKGSQDQIQISAPIQPGNSGGPVIGEDFSLKGVVVSSASTVATAQKTGVLAQGINFAISPNIVHGWLVQNDIKQPKTYATNIKEAINSTGMITVVRQESKLRNYVLKYSYIHYWDLGDHIRNLKLELSDESTGDIILNTYTHASTSGVQQPVRDAVKQIIKDLQLETIPLKQQLTITKISKSRTLNITLSDGNNYELPTVTNKKFDKEQPVTLTFKTDNKFYLKQQHWKNSIVVKKRSI
ncbi:S1C family serine protease [Thalassomonas sp. M1454]|uniref:S1C family serine protease n=1 Tax=Thalassomonas sp. M1454 TaxID=2594477 RepID=UPI00163D6666|nr:S1C family serine protease [Thalassomonas sp. M1454]